MQARPLVSSPPYPARLHHLFFQTWALHLSAPSCPGGLPRLLSFIQMLHEHLCARCQLGKLSQGPLSGPFGQRDRGAAWAQGTHRRQEAGLI